MLCQADRYAVYRPQVNRSSAPGVDGLGMDQIGLAKALNKVIQRQSGL
jgi:hypothetical protein